MTRVMQDRTEQCQIWLIKALESQHRLSQAAAGHCQAYTACASTAAQCMCSATGSRLNYRQRLSARTVCLEHVISGATLLEQHRSSRKQCKEAYHQIAAHFQSLSANPTICSAKAQNGCCKGCTPMGKATRTQSGMTLPYFLPDGRPGVRAALWLLSP